VATDREGAALTLRRKQFAALAAAFMAMVGALAFLRPDGARPPSPAPTIMDRALALIDASAATFPPPTGPWTLTLPRDHGAHPEMRTETWSVIANLTDEAGAPLGLEFSLLRLSLTPPSEDEVGTPWALRRLYRAHLAGTGAALGGAVAEERFSRGALGVAGWDAEAGVLRLDDWALTLGGSGLSLAATLDGAALTLDLTPAKPPSAADTDGGPIRGYALTRLDAVGRLETARGAVSLRGAAWLDHLWGELPLPGGPIAWDRLQLHLGDGRELSVVRSRRRRSGDVVSAQGFVVEADGGARALASDALTMTPDRFWRAPDGAAYPVAWRLAGDGVDLTIMAVADNQLRAFAQPLWSGAVAAEGALDGHPVSGMGALTLTGYATP
jgi:predicted secreted hydrolase